MHHPSSRARLARLQCSILIGCLPALAGAGELRLDKAPLFARTVAAAPIVPASGVALDSRRLSLDDAIATGERRSARLAAQEAAVAAVGEQVFRARELPDPKLRF